MAEILKYTGTIQPHHGEHGTYSNKLFPYIPSAELVETVNLAIYLERPLLLKGEPGTGKTSLAIAVAYELNLPLETWYVKSTSRARDGLYTYDAIRRLQDAQLAAVGRTPPTYDVANYVRWGPLGRAFSNEQRTVVLIDEIDKADIDFPNDLLLELDERRFLVEETDQMIVARQPPIVFITSNDEKELPDAFLRRCLFHYVEFPTYEALRFIVSVHFPDLSPTLAAAAIERFIMLREMMVGETGLTGKRVSTSELIDWIRVLRLYPEDETLAQLGSKLPFASVLLKNWEDQLRYVARS